jgi:hypothetical protein
VSGVEQPIDDGVPARGLGEGAVDENDRGWHGRSFGFWWIGVGVATTWRTR